MNKFGLLLCSLLISGTSVMFGQIEKNIKISEVMTNNTANVQDEYGQCKAWIEIANISHTTYNIRGMYITTNRAVLNKELSVPERIKMMSVIPNGENRTNLGGHQHLLFYCNSKPAQGSLHLSVPVDSGKPTWVALYNGNGVNLIDSVTVPALEANQSYALVKNEDGYKWQICSQDIVTPWISNDTSIKESKIARLKREDPHGFGITILAMGIVFFCLALLWIFFTLFGMFMRYRSKVTSIQPLKAGVKTMEMTKEVGHITSTILQDGLKTKGIDKEVYIAVISMALKQYQDNIHDVESGIITIKPKQTDWSNEYHQMTHFHE